MTSSQPYSVQNPPDGGWGWVIVGAAFLTFFMTTGTMMSMSVMYVAWLEEFHTGRGITSWIIAVAVAVMFGIGPIPAHLAIRFGYRAVMFAGGVLSFVGFVVSSFATSVPVLIFTIGIVAGTGCGFCFLPAIAMVSLYFDKQRSVAMGIAAAGAGIGSLLGAQILHHLVETFGWRGAMLVHGGIQLNLIVLALLMRPLPPGPGTCEELVVAVDDVGGEEEEETADDTTESLLGGETRSRADSEVGSKRANGMISLSSSRVASCEKMPEPHSYPDHPPVLLSVPLSVNPQHRRLLNMEACHGGDTGSLQHLAVPRDATSRLFASANELNLKKRHTDSLERNSMKHSGNLDILLSGSMHSLFLLNNNVIKYDDSYSHHSLNIDASSSAKSDLDSKNKVLSHQQQESCLPYKACMASLASNIELLKNPTFLMFIISNILTNLSFFMPNLYMADRALDEGLNKDEAAILVSINGAGNVFGRLFFGYLADKNLMQRISWYILVLSVCGVATCFSPLCGGSVVLHGIYAFTFGCFIGAYVTLAPVVTVDLVGVEVVGQAYGLALFFMGVSGLFGSPLAGWIFDWTGNYTTSFIVHGVFLAVSAVVLIPVAVYTGRRMAHVTHTSS